MIEIQEGPMRTSATNIKDCLTIEMPRHLDGRGFFQEMFSQRWANSNNMFNGVAGYVNWQQVNWSQSDRHVLRGIHVAPYGKLVTCLSGQIMDVVVDLREDSVSYLDHFFTMLSPEQTTQVFVPPGCGHAFLSLQPNTSVVYLQSDVYSTLKEWSVRWDDPQLAINWPVKAPILSDKDAAAPTVKEALKARADRLVKDINERERVKRVLEALKQAQSQQTEPASPREGT